MTLNKSEWTIMEKLWEQPYTMMQLYHMLEEETGWSKSTVVTMLGRMVDKGLIAYSEGGRAREYYPLVTKEDVALSETKSLLDRVFKGSVNMMMSTLVKSNELSKDEINELQAILKKAGEKADYCSYNIKHNDCCGNDFAEIFWQQSKERSNLCIVGVSCNASFNTCAVIWKCCKCG